MRRLRNLTITVEPDVLRRVRVKAAEQQKSVARYVGDLLRQQVMDDDEYERARRAYFAIPRTALKKKGRYPSREELYDRPVLRRH